jgi:predicted nucleotidyltransferase
MSLDVRALLAALSEGGVEFVVIGGIALALHGSVRTTEDLDIVPDPDPANLDRLCRLLEAEQATLLLNPARRFGAREAWMLRRGRNVSLTTEHGDIDLVRRLPGVPDYESLRQDAERFDVDGLTITVASPGQLIAMKHARGSAQDGADIETLRLLEHDD